MASKPDTRSSGQKRGAPPLQESALTPSDPPPRAARPFVEGSASAGSQAGPGSGPAGHAAHQGGEGLPPKLRWAVWPSASGGARPLPSQPVSCLQTGLRWGPG